MKPRILNVDRGQPVFCRSALTTIVSQAVAQRRFSLVLLAFSLRRRYFLRPWVCTAYVVCGGFADAEIGIRMALERSRGRC